MSLFDNESFADYAAQRSATLTDDQLASYQLFLKTAPESLIWMSHYLPHWFKVPLSLAHADLCRHFVARMLMDKSVIGDTRRTLVRFARTCGKSTTTKANMLWFLCEAPRETESGQRYVPHPTEVDLAYRTSTDDMARSQMKPLLYEIEHNGLILNDYGRLLSNRREQMQGGFDVAFRNGMRLMFGGKDSTWRGEHPICLVDDDSEKDSDVSTPEAVDRAFRDWAEIIDQAMILPDRRAFHVANPIARDCVFNRIADLEDTLTISKPILEIDDTGAEKSMWPAMYPTEYLLNRRRIMGEAFNKELMFIYRDGDRSAIREDEFLPYDPEEVIQTQFLARCYKITCCDPAISQKKKSCNTGIVTLAITNTPQPIAYVLSVTNAKMTGHQTLDTLITAYSRWQRPELFVENIGFQELFREWNSDRAKYGATSIPLQGMEYSKHGIDKKMRLSHIEDYVKKGQVKINPDDPMQKELVRQLVYFDPNRSDIADAFCNALCEGMDRVEQASVSKIRTKVVRDKTGRIIRSYKTSPLRAVA